MRRGEWGEWGGWGWTAMLAALAAVMATGLTAPYAGAARTLPQRPAAAAAAAKAEPYRAAILVDAESGTVLFEKDPHQPRPPASMTKMMLMLLVAERVRDGSARWDDPIPTSSWASQIGGSQVYLKQGEVFSLGEMMQAITIQSANDAAVAVAEALAGSAAAFVDAMNRRARELGMRNTVFHTVHGLPPGKGQTSDMSTPYDLALLARALVKFPEIMRWSATTEAPFRNGALILTNTNRLVRETGWVDGLKTGSYRDAGFNVTATGARDGLRLISVIMGAPEKRDCFSHALRLLQQGFAEYQALHAIKRGDIVASDVPVKNGKPRFVRVIAAEDFSVLARRGEPRNFSVELALHDGLQAPLRIRDRVGDVIVKDGDAVLGRVPALADEAIEQQTSLWELLF